MHWLMIIDVDALVGDYWCGCVGWWLLVWMHWLIIIGVYVLVDDYWCVCIGW